MGWQVGVLSWELESQPDHFAPRSTVPIIDQGRRVIALLAGQPAHDEDSDWAQAVQEVETVMRTARMNWTSAPEHQRGTFIALPVGVSFGGGQEV